jgi:hypothetical protein
VGKRVGRGSRVRGREGGEVAECAVESGGEVAECAVEMLHVLVEWVSESDGKCQNVRHRVW